MITKKLTREDLTCAYCNGHTFKHVHDAIVEVEKLVQIGWEQWMEAVKIEELIMVCCKCNRGRIIEKELPEELQP